MIVTVPVEIPVTVPDIEPTVALLIMLLLQTPPEVASLNVVVPPTHTDVGAPMIGVIGLTTIVATFIQPDDAIVYVTVVEPGATPVTTPEVPANVAIDVLLLDQVPPAVASLNDVVPPRQTLASPRIALIGLMVSTNVAEQPRVVV